MQKYKVNDQVQVLPVLNIGVKLRQGKIIKVEHLGIGSYPLYHLSCGGVYYGDYLEII